MKHAVCLSLGLLGVMGVGCDGSLPSDEIIDDALHGDGAHAGEGGGDVEPPLPPTPDCLFGEAFWELKQTERLELTEDQWITSEADLEDDIQKAQLVRAVQQSSHSDVTTVAEALSRVDQNEVRRIWLSPLEGVAPEFVVYEYGAGDNSYGAFFRVAELPVVASIHDGDILDCQVFVEPE